MMPSSTAGGGGEGGDGGGSGSGSGSGTTTSASPSPSPSSSSSSSSSSSFWCYECEASVDIASPSISLVCPHCQGGFLEEIPRNPNSNPDPALNTPDPSSHRRRFDRLRRLHYFRNLAPSDFIHDPDEVIPRFFDLPLLSNRNYDDSIDRIIRHLDDDVHLLGGRGPSPAPKSSIDAIPTVEITAAFLNEDPQLLCAVCKDEFAVGIEAKRLPCSHIYHSDCIVPWLMQHNSCPVCRFQLTTNVQEDGERRRRRRTGGLRRIRGLRMVDALNEFDLEEVLTGIDMRNGRAHPLVSSSAGVSGVSPSQMAEAEVGSVGPTNSIETVPSVWDRDGGTSMAGAAAAQEVDEDTDVVSMDRRGTLE